MINIGNGKYWKNNDFQLCLKNTLEKLNFNEEVISLNVNIDGLPIYKSSKAEFWPILCNLFELPQVKPFIIGIYYGQGKPCDVKEYLQFFVDEIKLLMEEGLIISTQNKFKAIKVKIRSFICDSPARAFIKGKCCSTRVLTKL